MAKIKKTLHLEDMVITFFWEEFDGDIDVDDMTKIHYENLFGDAVTVSTLLNRIGLLRNSAEHIQDVKKQEMEIYEAELDERLRKNAASAGEKITEKQIEKKITKDKGYVTKKKNYLSAKRDFQNLETIYWGVQSKDKKLEVLMKGTTPKEFEEGIIEGKINSILINKQEKRYK